MSECEYVRNYYDVPACIGRAVIVNGRSGVISEDRGHYIGVNFDDDKPGSVFNCHPTWKVEYGDMKKVRKMTRSQQRYKRYLEWNDCFDSFIDFCVWDADPERDWNKRA